MTEKAHFNPDIEDHGLIGDCGTAALVARDGCVDFMCWPKFDSPSLFASVLGEAGGSFELRPEHDGPGRQIYLTETAILFTRFLSPHAVAEVSDFMPMSDDDTPRLIRRAKGIRGETRFVMSCRPGFDYGRAGTVIEETEDGVILSSDGADGTRVRLRSNVPLSVEGDRVVARFTLEPDQTAWFSLESPDVEVDNRDHWVSEQFKATADFWRGWTKRSTYRGRWRDLVQRSAITLKLLTCRRTGAMIAAPTFGLPETPGGERNWDYRYVWLRDAAFSCYAFLRLGYTEEADSFLRWLGDRALDSDEGRLNVMFRLSGEDAPKEVTLDHLSGYDDSVPVRIGNDARGQRQLDVYGGLMDAIYLADKHGDTLSRDAWVGVRRTVDWVSDNWNEPDEGIWEIRGEPRHHLHSRLMCWVAIDRALRLARKRSLPAPEGRWQAARDAIHEDIHENFWNEEMGAFTQSRHGDAMDAACLMMPLVRFIGPTDPRWLSTLTKLSERLTSDVLVYRYSADRAPDGLDGIEGTFNMCSFWFVEAVGRSGDLEQARFLFDKLTAFANPLGLFAEETGPSGEQLGNFPQALTHMSLISAAFWLNRALDRQESRD
ncbi:glycoside hydrolase family 15 protein [Pelagovum pacificum]|uniref:Glycoside hydrolase family 15 protein n=1 Tax=Pelagovum pacificum TaxID=2588711 RepID=A0A5C5GF50_9RHOB|nr:glycoside hydrolase family 15 protein [Pelagovum pacificum]QQA44190.1 glycoside hydrolase family 15 protein [Pelagovum pacificum]TNY32687.1 glycoside hydrolase family 15 protein [Pelagovum pacificum]